MGLSSTAVARDRPRSSGTPMPIRTRGLSKRYDDRLAVDKLDLDVRPGEIFGLLGQNGAGKTTTILMLLGLTEPSDGEARVLGLDPARNPLAVKRRVGYLPDSVGFYGSLTGRENLRYTARLNGLSGDSAEDRITAVIEQVGLSDRADTRTDTFSRGMLQRLGIADALVKDPQILILDEPTTAIDPLGVVEILDLLRRLVDEHGISILLSSHLLNQVQSVCDRIGIFAMGRLVGQGTLAELGRRFGDGMTLLEVGVESADGVELQRARSILEAVPDVAGVDFDTHSRTWRLQMRSADAEPRVRARVLSELSAAGLQISSLRAVVPSLDDIYRRAVERAGLGSAVAAAVRDEEDTPIDDEVPGRPTDGLAERLSGLSRPRPPRVIGRKGGRRPRR
jgi:ABC-2 type transport system ATP-binding protein